MVEEKIYTISLWHKVAERKARPKRTPYAMSTVQNYLLQHAGVNQVKIGKHLNEAIWQGGKKHPPHKIRVKAVIDGDVAKVELFGHDYQDFKPVSTAKREKLMDKLRSRLGAKAEQAQELEDKIAGKDPAKAGEQEKPVSEQSKSTDTVKEPGRPENGDKSVKPD
jgi:large subunit ribosomal protein L31e